MPPPLMTRLPLNKYTRMDQLPEAAKQLLKSGFENIDKNAKARADEFLTHAAQNATMDTWRNSWRGAHFVMTQQGRPIEYGAVFAGKVAVAVGIGFAGIGMAALVGTSVATFGVMPVVGLVVGYSAKLTFEEMRYQRSSSRLHAALEKISDKGTSSRKFMEVTWIPIFLDTLDESGDKINTKYLRLSRLRGWSFGLKQGSPHAKEAIPSDYAAGTNLLHGSQINRDGKTGVDTPKSPGMALAALELNFYSQTIYNLCDEFLKEISIRRYEFRESMWKVREAINLQVHFLGNHHKCGDKCAGQDDVLGHELKRLIEELGRVLKKDEENKGKRPVQTASLRADFENALMVMAQVADSPPVGTALSDMSGANTTAAREARMKMKDAESRIERWETGVEIGTSFATGMAADFGASQALAAGVEGSAGTLKALHDLSINAAGEGVREAAGAAMTSVGVSAIFESATELAIALMKNRHQTKKIGALASDRVAQKMDETSLHDALVEAKTAKFTREHLGYLGKKAVHYFHKVEELKDSQAGIIARVAQGKKGVFGTCENAHAVWHDLCYIDKQYAKLEMTVIGFMAVLLQMDKKLHFYNLTKSGSMVDENPKKQPPVPSYHGHMKRKSV